MILILSEETDTSTVHIIEWLSFWKIPFIRINKEDKITLNKIAISPKSPAVIIEKGNQEIDLLKVKAFWYRRGFLKINYHPEIFTIRNKRLSNEVNDHLLKESSTVEEFLNFVLNSKPRIGSFGTRRVNKIIVLHLAKKHGLEIPSTYLADNLLNLQESFENPLKALITKAISEGFYFTENENKLNQKAFLTYTEEIPFNFEYPQHFYVSLFQEKIEKEADIRIFYILGEFYSMGIISQSDKRTEVDFRKYYAGEPNRNFPIKLPEVIELKLHALMKELQLESGSIDMVLTKSGQFVFIEVNPVGQFNMVSVPCNYHLEKLFAKKLTELSADEK